MSQSNMVQLQALMSDYLSFDPVYQRFGHAFSLVQDVIIDP